MVEHNFHVSAIKRHHETIIPRGDDRICENDILYFTTTRDHVDELLEPTKMRRKNPRTLLLFLLAEAFPSSHCNLYSHFLLIAHEQNHTV